MNNGQVPACPQERLGDHADANAQRLWLGASLLQKKLVQSYSSRISGIMKNHNTYLAPGLLLNVLVPAPANVVIFQGLLGSLPVRRPHHFYQMSSQQGNHHSPCGLRTLGTLRTLLSAPWDSPFPPEHCQVLSYGVSDSVLPLFIES